MLELTRKRKIYPHTCLHFFKNKTFKKTQNRCYWGFYDSNQNESMPVSCIPPPYLVPTNGIPGAWGVHEIRSST
jgi:hypothetical protein